MVSNLNQKLSSVLNNLQLARLPLLKPMLLPLLLPPLLVHKLDKLEVLLHLIQDSPDLDLEDLSHLDLEEPEDSEVMLSVLTEEDWPDLDSDSDSEEDLDLEEMDTHGPRLVTTPNMPPLIHLMTNTSTL